MIRKLIFAVGAVSLLAAPVGAYAAPVRVPAHLEGDSDRLFGLLWSYIIVPAILAAIIALVTSGNNNEMPKSP
ncbi:MAG: hypothetical protein ABIT09_08740 [Croceibacterium sp.]